MSRDHDHGDTPGSHGDGHGNLDVREEHVGDPSSAGVEMGHKEHGGHGATHGAGTVEVIPVALDAVRHAINQLVQRATAAASDGDLPPPPDLEPLRQAGVPTVDDQTSHRAVAQLADHRHHLAQIANESLWPVTTP